VGPPSLPTTAPAPSPSGRWEVGAWARGVRHAKDTVVIYQGGYFRAESHNTLAEPGAWLPGLFHWLFAEPLASLRSLLGVQTIVLCAQFALMTQAQRAAPSPSLPLVDLTPALAVTGEAVAAAVLGAILQLCHYLSNDQHLQNHGIQAKEFES
jgi:hypothetical protein